MARAGTRPSYPNAQTLADAAPPDAAAAAPPATLADAADAGYYVTPSLADARDADACRSHNDAVWALSSARPGSGIPQLLSDDVRGGVGQKEGREAGGAFPRPALTPARRPPAAP